MPFSDGSFKPRVFANIKSDKTTKDIYFEINEKDKQPIRRKELTANLKEIKIKPWVYEGKQKESIQFIFDDGAEDVWVEMGWGYVARSILNTLDSVDSIGRVKISLYKNKEHYPSAYVEVNGQKAGWRYKPEELPQVEKKMIRGEEVYDDYEAIKFFKEKVIPSINSKIQDKGLVQSEMKQNSDEPQVKEDSWRELNIQDDLPF